jgi:hypothetical protein
MAYLTVWPPFLRRQALTHSTVTVLNPGSVFWLAALREFGPEITTTHRYESWWYRMLELWAALLDMIIWLEAPDRILLERVLGRDSWHEAKDQPQQETLRCFARYRTCYEQILSAMTANGGPEVLHFRTDQLSADQMVEEVLAALGLRDRQVGFTPGDGGGPVHTRA